ncbi:uncharacterized protein LOC119187123 [Rhipicephalus microplus]|uniref:uncharacterized protein LOC119187123 n=1 Tax=Rhipicephalus microplus TaxID=6941 RepID=UPI003F6ACAF0
MASKARFQDGEKVLCFHGPLLYVAKCIMAQVKDEQTMYFIHYRGWNKNWDEWFPESRVLEFNDVNLQKQKELQKAHLSSASHSHSIPKGKRKKLLNKKKEGEKKCSKKPQKRKGAAATAAAASYQRTSSQASESGGERRRKKRRRLDTHVESEKAFLPGVEIKVRIPEELKPWLVDDWDLMTKQKKLVQLPCNVTVDRILTDYVKQATSVQGISSKKLGSMLAYTPLDETSVQLLLHHIHDFLNGALAGAESVPRSSTPRLVVLVNVAGSPSPSSPRPSAAASPVAFLAAPRRAPVVLAFASHLTFGTTRSANAEGFVSLSALLDATACEMNAYVRAVPAVDPACAVIKGHGNAFRTRCATHGCASLSWTHDSQICATTPACGNTTHCVHALLNICSLANICLCRRRRVFPRAMTPNASPWQSTVQHFRRPIEQGARTHAQCCGKIYYSVEEQVPLLTALSNDALQPRWGSANYLCLRCYPQHCIACR